MMNYPSKVDHPKLFRILPFPTFLAESWKFPNFDFDHIFTELSNLQGFNEFFKVVLNYWVPEMLRDSNAFVPMISLLKGFEF